MKWKSDLFAEYFAAIADRGFMALSVMLALRRAPDEGLNSPQTEHSDSLYPPH